MALIRTFVRLRWRLLRGAIRHGGAEQAGAVVSIVISAVLGLGGGIAMFITARTVEPARDVGVIACTALVVAAIGFGIVAGVAQPVDPRVFAPEPLTDRQRTIGLLSAAAFGPAGLSGIGIGVGLGAGMARSPLDVPVVTLAILAWLGTLLLVARTATNGLALVLQRFPRAGQFVVGVAGLGFYGLFQFVPILLDRLDEAQRTRLVDGLQWTPPGQLGLALTGPTTGTAVVHLFAGAIWVPLLAGAFTATTRQLAASVRATPSGTPGDVEMGRFRSSVRRACGDGTVGVIAWRSLILRFRTPRTALETVTGAGVGLAAAIAPVLLRDNPGSGAVLVGGAVQLAVLFMAGNSFGNDGPAVTHELLTGLSIRTLVRGKARSILIVAAPLAVIGPLVAAAIAGEWRYLLAGFGVGIGGLLAGTGAALVQSALVPIAVPESDNPFASGETGQGFLAAVTLFAVLMGLAVVTLPVALALFWAVDRGSVVWVTVFSLLTIVGGAGALRLGGSLATRRLSGREPEFVAAVTPAR